MGKTITTRVTLPIVAMGGVAVREAALAAGAMDKFRVVFGEFADDMDSFVDDLRTRMAIPRRQIVAMASGIQDLLVPMGFAREEATNMTKEMLELANQIAVFNDVSPQQVLEAMQSGLVGASQPLRRFGIDASVAALEQVALSEGLIDAEQSFSKLDAETRKSVQAQALMIQMTKQSSDAIEGYESNMDAIIPRFNDFMATIQDLAAEIGEVLLPVLDKILKEHILPLIESFKGLDDQTKKNIVIIAGLVAAVGPLLIVMGTLLSSITTIIAVVKGLGVVIAFLAASPIAILVTAIGILAFMIWKNWDQIKAAFQLGVNFVQDRIKRMVDRILFLPRVISGALSSLPSAIIKPFKEAFDWITRRVDQVADRMKKLNPLQRFSPSLVDQIRHGISAVEGEFSRLDNIEIPKASDLFGDGEMSSNNAVVVNVGSVNEKSDIDMITRELGFRSSLAI